MSRGSAGNPTPARLRIGVRVRHDWDQPRPARSLQRARGGRPNYVFAPPAARRQHTYFSGRSARPSGDGTRVLPHITNVRGRTPLRLVCLPRRLRIPSVAFAGINGGGGCRQQSAADTGLNPNGPHILDARWGGTPRPLKCRRLHQFNRPADLGPARPRSPSCDFREGLRQRLQPAHGRRRLEGKRRFAGAGRAQQTPRAGLYQQRNRDSRLA